MGLVPYPYLEIRGAFREIPPKPAKAHFLYVSLLPPAEHVNGVSNFFQVGGGPGHFAIPTA